MRSPLATALTLAMLAVPGPASAAVLGIGDQSPATFHDKQFKKVGFRHARLVTPWNSVFTDSARLDAWMQAAHSAGIEPLVAFNHGLGERCPAKPCRAPSIGRYRHAFAAFRKRYPWVRQFQPWNEANHQSQPTATRPELAASYYNVIRQRCRGCTIVAADVLDSKNMVTWLARFRQRAKGRPSLWGLHNYTDVNRFRTDGTRRMLSAVSGRVWLTETGGIVTFRTTGGKVALRYDERRAARAYKFLLRLATAYRRRIRRVYVYQWRKTAPSDRFDAGVVRPGGKPRPSLVILRRALGAGGGFDVR
jgi:hypothetical protein